MQSLPASSPVPVEMPKQGYAARPPGTAVAPCPLLKSTTKPIYFNEIEFVDETDQPVPWEEYRVQLPAGALARGYLDQNGWAPIDNLAVEGDSQVTFPALDKEAWTVHKTSPLAPLGAAA